MPWHMCSGRGIRGYWADCAGRGLWGVGAAFCCGNPGCSDTGSVGRGLRKQIPVLGGLSWGLKQEVAKVGAAVGRGGHSVSKLCRMGTGLWWRAQGR